MKKYLSMLMLLAALVVPWASRAQSLGDYTFSTGTDSTMWVDMTGSTQILAPSGSDGLASSVQNIGFTFPFGGEDYTQFSVNTDGNLRLGSTVTGTANYSTPFSASNAIINNPKINVFGCDGYGNSGSHYVKKLLVDDSILIVEFCTGTYNSTTRSMLYKWQIHMYESGRVDIVYPGASGIPATAPNVARQPGMCVNNSDIWLISATHVATHYTVGQESANVALGNWPDAGRYYSFVPPYFSCPRPHFTMTNITTNSVDLTITPGGSESEWILKVDNNDWENLYSTSHTVNNLSSGQLHTFVLAAICGSDDTSFYTTMSCYTACGTITASDLPYLETFESYASGTTASISPCWTKGTNGSTAYPYPNTTVVNGARSLYFYGYYPSSATSTRIYSYAALPPIDESLNMSDLQVNFMARRYSTTTTYYNSYIVVGIADSLPQLGAGMDTSVTWIDTVNLTSLAASAITSNEVTFENYTGTGRYVVFYSPVPPLAGSNTYAYNYIYIDDIILRNIPTCFWPNSMNLATVGANDATVTWSPDSRTANPNGWSVEYGEHGFVRGTGTTEMVYDTTITLTNLTANTEYDIYVSADCGSELSDPTMFTFRTACTAIDVLPYTMDFEGAATGTTSSAEFVPCLTRHNSTTSYYPYVGSTASYCHSGVRGLYWYCPTTSGAYQYVVMPAVDTDLYAINTLQLRFWARATGTSYSPVFQVGVMTNPTDISTFHLVQTINVGTNTTYTEYTVALGGYEGYGSFIAIRGMVTTSAWYATVDDITIEPMPTCPAITNLEASTTVGSALLTWGYQDGFNAPDGYEVTYDSIGGTNATVVTPTEPNVMLTGLAANTTYKVYVQADCGGDGMGLMDSIIITTKNFNCLELDPATADTVLFSNSTSGISGCIANSSWGNTAYQTIYTAAELTAAGLTAGNITGIDLGFTANTANAKEFTIFIANTSTTSISSTTFEVPTADMQVYGPAPHPMNTSGWHHYEFTTPFYWNGTSSIIITTFMNQPEGVSQTSSTGLTGYYVSASNKARYRYKDSSPFTLDDVATTGTAATTYSYRAAIHFYKGECQTMATCAAPAVAATYVSADTVELAWVPGYNETAWDVAYREDGATAWTTVATGVTTTSYTVDGLNPGTDYEFRVSFECNDDNLLYAGTTTATTPCLPVSLPYSENFDNVTTSTSTTNYGLMPNCWEYTMTGSSTYQTGSYLPRVYYSTSTNYVHSGNYCLYLYGVGIFELPEMPTSLDSLTISFYDYVSSSSYGLIIGAVENGVFVPIDTADLVISSPTLVEVNLSSYHGTSRKIALRNYYTTSTSTYYSYNYIDNIYVDYTPTCPHVTHIEVDSVSESSISLSWTAGGDETEWSVVYGDVYTTTSTPSITITGLVPNTPYTFEVRALCNDNDSSTAMEFNVRTLCEPYLPLPYVENFDGYTTSTTAATGVQIPCWNALMTGTATYQTGSYLPMVYYGTSYAHSGSYSMRLYGVGYHSLPQLPVAASLTTISFWATSTSSSYKCYFGVMSDPNVATTFDTIQELTFAAYSTPQYFEIDLANYTGTGRYLAFRNVYTSTTTYYSYIYLDDVEVWQTTNCPAPVVNVAEVEPTSITVTWFDTTGNSHNGTTIYWSMDENINHAQSVVVSTGNSYTINGLTPGTDYYLWISGNCASENSRPMRLEVTTASTCSPIENLTASSVTDNAFGISWSAPTVGNAATSYIVYLRKCTNTAWDNTEHWIIDTTSNTYYLFSGLDAATTYAYAVRTLCGSGYANYDGGYITTTICEMDTVGDYATNYSAQPIYATQAYSYTQQIYLASELEGIDSISSIALYQRGYSYNDRNVTVYLGYTAKDEFATTTDAVPFSNLTQVYSGNLGGFGWVSLQLDSVYVRNTDSNLVVAIDDNTGVAYPTNCYWACSNFGSIYRSIRYYGSNINPVAPSGSSARDYYRAYIVFGNAACEPDGCAAPIVVQSSATANRVDIAWNADTNITYTVEYRALGATNWTTVSAATNTGVDSIMGIGSAFQGEVRVSYNCFGNTISGYVSISTPCGPAALPLMEDFQAQEYGTYSRNCWMIGTTNLGTTYPLPRVTSLTGAEDDQLMMLYNGAYIILPEVAEDLDSLQIRFKLTQGGTNVRLLLGLMTDVSMPIYTMYVLDTLIRSEIDATNSTVDIVYQFGQLDSAYHHARIAFWDAFNDNYNFLNDIVVEYVPHCTVASDFDVDTVTTTTATISWLTDGENATSYIVEYGPRYFTPGTGTSVAGTGTPFTITGLAHSTSYDAYVYTVCAASNDTSIASSVIRFETQCDVVTTLPYTMDFECGIVPPGSSPADALPNCWEAASYGALPHVIYSSTSSYYGSADHCFQFSAIGIAALPQMSMPLNTVKLSFRDYNVNESTNGLIVGTVTGSGEGFYSTFVPYDTVDFTGLNAGVRNVEVYFNEYVGNGNRIAICNYSKNGGSTSEQYIDDIVVEPMPACIPPQHVRVEYVIGNEAYIVWSRSNSSTYDVYYRVHGDTSAYLMQSTMMQEILLTGLQPLTQYDVRIATDCGDTVNTSFTTPCNAVTLPYVENFDSYTTSTTAATGYQVNCWNYIMTNSSYASATYQPQVYYSSTYANSGNYSMRLYGVGYIMLPPMPTSLDSLQMTFFPYKTSDSYNLEVGVMEGNTFVPVDTINYTMSTHPEILVKFNNYHGNSRIIAFHNVYGTTGYSYHYIDDIEVDYIPTCPKVDSLQATAVLNNSVELYWAATGTENEWEVTVNGNDTIVYNTIPVITGLQPDTDYVITVRPICDVNDTGRARTITIHTTCDPVTLPYTENFDNLSTSTTAADNYGVMPNCWNYTLISTTASYTTGTYLPGVYYSTSYSNSGSYCLRLAGAGYFMLPPMPTSLDSLEMTFSNYITSSSYGLEVGVMEGSTFVPMQALTTPTSTHTQHTVYFATYTGNSRTIAFRNTYSSVTYSYNYIDDIDIHYIPTCAHVMGIAVDSASPNSITIDWVDVTPAIQYQVEYGVAGFTQGTGTILTTAAHPTTINGLATSTSYQFYVRPICAVGDTAEWYGPLTAATECVATTLPYTQNFDAVPGTTYSTAGQLPACWDGYSNGTTSTYTPHVVSSGSYWYADSANSLIMTSGSDTYGNTKVVALPPFTDPVSAVTMSFWMSTESSTNGYLCVGYLTGPNFATDFVTVDSIHASSTTYHGSSSGVDALGFRDTVSFANAPANAQRIAFMWVYTTSFYSCCIDDVSVWAESSCPAPLVTVTNVDYHSATVTAYGDGQSFVLNYGTDVSNLGSTMTSTTGIFNVTGLTPNTTYFYQVVQNCDSNEVSPETTGLFVTADLPCFAVTNLQVAGTGYTSVDLTWTAGGNETAWEVKVYNNIDTFSMTTALASATVNGLMAQTGYYANVRPLCGSGADVEGPWCDSAIYFTTDYCHPVENVTVTAGITTATVVWTAPEGANNFRVAYGPEGFPVGGETGIYNVTSNPFELTDLEPETPYTVQVANVCSDDLVSAWARADFVTLQEEGIVDIDAEGNISLFPNPASTTVTIGLAEVSDLTIVDLNGREVFRANAVSSATIDVSTYAKGAYFVRVVSESGTSVRKLVVK